MKDHSIGKKIRVGVSVGDLNGIGMEVILKTFLDKRMMEICTPIVFGSARTSAYHRKLCEIQNFSFNIIDDIKDVNQKRANLINCWDEDVKVVIGEETEGMGKYALLSFKKSIEALKNNYIDVLVTAPINKFTARKFEKDFIGHTEFLEKNFDGNSLMIMVSDQIKIACVTSHIPLSKVSEQLSVEKIKNCIKSMNNTLMQDFAITRPKIAILGINPHAGENGMLGREEGEIITPAIQETAVKHNILCFGPFSSDTFFTRKNIRSFDAVIAMYHDQALMPFKMISFNDGVNYTAGLSIVRTSPVHGTAYDIAGKNIANEQSFRSSIYLACKIIKTRKEYLHLKSNSLKQ